MPEQGVFTRVIEDGAVRVGDFIELDLHEPD
jgi:MOSC domain-containing protein YiiM